MDTIRASDLQVLSQYSFIKDGSNKQNNHLIGLKWVKEEGKWNQELVEIDKCDVSCWSLFLSLFGMGNLKNVTLSLDKICSYLAQYQWREIKLSIDQNSEEPMYKAFKNVCHLANRQMQHHRFQLFQAVSDPIHSDFNHYWNPVMNGRFLLGLQSYRLPEARGIELRFKDSKIAILPNQMLSKEEIAEVEVGFKYELIVKTDYDEDDRPGSTYYYHYPSNPYYSVEIDRSQLLPRRQELQEEGEFGYQIGQLTSHDLQVLSHYRFIEDGSNKQNSHLIGLKQFKEGEKWIQELVEINKCDVSCWSLFLSVFGMGNLKDITFSLDKICSYLAQYQWREIKLSIDQNPEEPMYKAFKTACHLANRCMQRHSFQLLTNRCKQRCSFQLFQAVSEPIQSDFNHYWNPAMNGHFLLELQCYRLPDARGIELRFKDSKVHVLPNQMLNKEEMAEVEVGYEYERSGRGSNYYFYYPELPYYSTLSTTNIRPPRREI